MQIRHGHTLSKTRRPGRTDRQVGNRAEQKNSEKQRRTGPDTRGTKRTNLARGATPNRQRRAGLPNPTRRTGQRGADHHHARAHVPLPSPTGTARSRAAPRAEQLNCSGQDRRHRPPHALECSRRPGTCAAYFNHTPASLSIPLRIPVHLVRIPCPRAYQAAAANGSRQSLCLPQNDGHAWPRRHHGLMA